MAVATPEITEEFPDNTNISFVLSDDVIASIVKAIHDENVVEIRQLLESLSVQDMGELISKIDEDSRTYLLEHFGDSISPDTIIYLAIELRKKVLASLKSRQVAQIVAALDSDDALDLIEDLDPVFQKDVIRYLSAKTRVALEEGLSYPEDSAGRLMQREFVAVPEFWTVGKTIDYLRAAADDLPSDFFDLFVITPTYHVKGEIPLNRLVRAKRSEKISNLTLDQQHTISARMDQEDVAFLFQREAISSAPVVDDDGRLIGVITVDDVIDVINEEAQEDILKLAGVNGEGDLYSAVFASTRSRFSWLFINLLTAIMASLVISMFDATIEQLVALAVLMPIVASMGGNAGTQAMTVAVRALATKEISATNSWRIIWKETLIGMLNGIMFAIIIGCLAGLYYSNFVLGTVIAVAMVVNLLVAGLSGAGIPILLNKMGSDPAISSAVVLTTVTDIVGFFVFLGLATLVL
ncbi:MAG: magnesium transporter [Rhodospirillales bacterium]|nr:magnesium transporter [Rhodospirillales bacterium]MCB9980447.1 magnesium transporter [Rhodospirillales bacterium]